MDTYIKRQALITHVKDLPTWWADDGGAYGHAMRYPEGMFNCEDIISSIENAPAEDVKPVIHARWIDVQDGEKTEGLWRCSVCGNEVFYPYWAPQEWGDYFCSQCGSKMDGDADA